MNKNVITTSMALVLAMAMVLAVGKTRQGEAGEATTETAHSVQAVIPTEVEDNFILSDQYAVLDERTVVIQPDVEQGDVILDDQQAVRQTRDTPADDPLFASLQKMQNALTSLQALAQDTELAFAELEKRRL